MSLAEAGNAADDWVSNLFSRAEPPPARGGAARRTFTSSDSDDDDGDPLERFRQVTHFETLLRAAVEAARLESSESPLILVLGAGDGANAVAPCLRVFRGARIVATDTTGASFPKLRRRLIESRSADRVACLEMAPEADSAPASRFDLVVGVSILHRLIDPDLALANAYRTLRPGGHAIFMEPFEGYGLIRIAFEQILREAELRGEPLAAPVAAALSSATANIAARTMPDRDVPGFSDREQKWLFSRESLAAGARQVGFSEVRFFSHNDHPTLYRDFAGVMLQQLLGPAKAPTPDWVWEVLDAFDRALPPPVKRLLMLEGTLVLTKSS